MSVIPEPGPEAALTELRFGTDGIRGPVGPVISQEVIARIVAGIVQYCATPDYRARAGHPAQSLTLVIGGDCRSTSDYFVQLAVTVALALGANVLKCAGYVTTPMLAHAVLDQSAHGGIMITASHNPADHNGIKFIPHYGGPAMPADTEAIERFLNADPPDLARFTQGRVETFNPAEPYAEGLARLIDFGCIREAKLRICFDALFGAGKGYFRQVMRLWDIPAQVLHGEDDPWMGKAMPDPNEERLAELSSQVRHLGFDLGLATDGDADRFAAVDAHGHFLAPNQCLAILAHYLYAYQSAQGGLVRSISTTHLLDRIARHHGQPTSVGPVGFKFLSAALRADRSLLMAGEESGGFALRGHVPEKDGLLACFLLLEAVAATGESLHELWAEVEATYGPVAATRLDWDLPDPLRDELVAWSAHQETVELAGETFTRVDPNRSEFVAGDGSWVLVRQSGTEDLVRVYLETDLMGRLDAMRRDVERWRE